MATDLSRVNVTVNTKVVTELRDLGENISKVTRRLLAEYLKDLRKTWPEHCNLGMQYMGDVEHSGLFRHYKCVACDSDSFRRVLTLEAMQ